MAKVKCDACGRNMLTTSSNSTYMNGVWVHLKCPKKVIIDQAEKEDWDALRKQIEQLCKDYKRPINWKMITAQIKLNKEMGYSYADQLYALNYVCELDGTFWGYSRVQKFLPHAMEHRQKYEEFQQKKKEQQAKPIVIKSKSDFKIDM